MSTQRTDTATSVGKQRKIYDMLEHVAEGEICSCPSLYLQSTGGQDREALAEEDDLLPVPPVLTTLVRLRIQAMLSSVTSLSVLLLHVSQLESIYITPQTEVVRKRKRFHPSADVVEQILTNVRRAVRAEDDLYFDTGRGAALLFPNVDQQGAHSILERVYNSVSLLQAETIVPPLTLETDIVLGIASYPEQGQSADAILACAGRVANRLTLRPALTTHLWDTMPQGDQLLDIFAQDPQAHESPQPTITHAPGEGDTTPIPFLQLPVSLSKRMKNLLSYKTATQFACVPVGRDHNRLTLAMANPRDTAAISAIRERTGMSIFPVACDRDALEALLAEHW